MRGRDEEVAKGPRRSRRVTRCWVYSLEAPRSVYRRAERRECVRDVESGARTARTRPRDEALAPDADSYKYNWCESALPSRSSRGLYVTLPSGDSARPGRKTSLSELILDFPELGPADHDSPRRDFRCDNDNDRGRPFFACALLSVAASSNGR